MTKKQRHKPTKHWAEYIVRNPRFRYITQQAELLKLNQDYQHDLEALRVKWGVPPEGYHDDQDSSDWQRSFYQRIDAHSERYRGLFKEAARRGWSEAKKGQLVTRCNRENPVNQIYRDVRTLNRRYGLGQEFDDYFRLLWQSHLGDFRAASVTFAQSLSGPPVILITPTLTRRQVEGQMWIVRDHQEKYFGGPAKSGRPKSGESRTLEIGETESGQPCIMLENLSQSLLRREWHKVKAIQDERWPDRAKRRHFRPAHSRRKKVAEFLDRVAGDDDWNISDLIDGIWPDGDFYMDWLRTNIIYQDTHRWRRELNPRDE